MSAAHDAISVAKSSVNHTPTDAQKRAGNYRKEHISFQGVPVSIENKKGSIRSGVDEHGHRWSCELPADYGYIKRTLGADGDHVDVYVGPDPNSKQVFIVNQHDHRTKKFDEHKVLLGFDSERAAMSTYCKAFSDGKGRDRCGSVEAVSMDAFKHWLANGATHRTARASDIIGRALDISRVRHDR